MKDERPGIDRCRVREGTEETIKVIDVSDILWEYGRCCSGVAWLNVQGNLPCPLPAVHVWGVRDLPAYYIVLVASRQWQPNRSNSDLK